MPLYLDFSALAADLRRIGVAATVVLDDDEPTVDVGPPHNGQPATLTVGIDQEEAGGPYIVACGVHVGDTFDRDLYCNDEGGVYVEWIDNPQLWATERVLSRLVETLRPATT